MNTNENDAAAVVFESNDPIVISMAKGALEAAEIPFWVDGNETGARLVMTPIMFPPCRFLVPKECEEEAREVLEQLEFPL